MSSQDGDLPIFPSSCQSYFFLAIEQRVSDSALTASTSAAGSEMVLKSVSNPIGQVDKQR